MPASGSLAGYLRELEAAYLTGRIPDYPRFPAGKLRKGIVPVRETLAPMEPETLRGDLFGKYEERIGTKQSGRGWHGLRRFFSAQYGDADARVRRAAQSWAPGSNIDETVYQEAEDPAVLAEAARLRARRPGVQPQEEG